MIMVRRILRPLLGLVLLAALAACDEATTVDLLEVDATGALFGLAFLDNNGNEILDGSDTTLEGLRILLTSGRNGAVVREVTTDADGAFVLGDIPVGAYELTLDPGTLGDTLLAAGGQGELVTIQRGDTSQVNFGVSYPVLTVEELRDYPSDRRVFTSGIALNPRVSFGDGLVHVQGEEAWVRATNVERANINAGDSVRFLGRTAVDAGQPILTDVTPFVLINQAAVPIAVEVSTDEAADARGGELDAALVRVRNGEISDTATINGSFRFTLDDGTGPVEVFLRSFLQLNTSPIRPDTIIYAPQVAGLLVPVVNPTGGVRWRILPRGGGDVALDTKLADIGLGVTATPAVARRGDTVEIAVVAVNSGPLGASEVSVLDSIPEALTLLEARTTRGSYADAVWTLDSLAVGARDTLRLITEVTGSGTGNIVNQAILQDLVNEVDPNPGNDVAAVVITIDP
jgi:uncharacterized repeat protein (TIGR01451 family)